MADPRFFDRLGPLTVTDIAALSGAAISDSRGLEVVDVADLASARAGAVSYLEFEKFLSQLEGKSLEGVALIVPAKLAQDTRLSGAVLLQHQEPRAAFAKGQRHFSGSSRPVSTPRFPPGHRLRPRHALLRAP